MSEYLTIFMPVSFCQENVCILCLLHIFRMMYSRLLLIIETNAINLTTLIMKANTINPEQSDLGTYCLQYRLLRCIGR